MTYILAIANQKGGVGKTTTSINLAACSAKIGYKTLLVDLDPQGNATTGLGVDTDEVEGSIYDALFDVQNSGEMVVSSDFENLDLLPSSINLAGAEIELVDLEKREFQLQKIFNHLQTKYDLIIIDCPPALGLLTINALVAAHAVCVPLQCEYYALEGISHLVRTITAVQAGLNQNLHIMGIILTMYDRRAKLTTMVEDDVREHFKQLVFNTVIPRNVRLSEAPSHGLPVIEYDHNAVGSLAYKALTKEILSKIEGSI